MLERGKKSNIIIFYKQIKNNKGDFDKQMAI